MLLESGMIYSALDARVESEGVDVPADAATVDADATDAIDDSLVDGGTVTSTAVPSSSRRISLNSIATSLIV